MKLNTLPAFLFSFIILTGAALAAETPVIDPQSEYAKAVKSYVEAATDQLQAVRNAVNEELKNASDDTKARFKKTYEGLDRTDKLLAKLKSAAPADFDGIKSEFEQARAKTLKEIDAARKG